MSEKKSSGYVREILGLYWQAAVQYKLDLLLCVFIPFSVLLTSVLAPYLSSRILANMLTDNTQAMNTLWLLAVVFAGGALANRVGMSRFMKLQAESLAYLHENVFNRLLQRGTRYYANQVSGKLVADVNGFVNSFSMLANALVINGLSFFIIVVVGLIIVTINVWQLGLFLLCFIAVLLTWTTLDSMKRSNFRTTRLAASRRLTAHLGDNITNMQTVKTFAREPEEAEKEHKLNDRLKQLRINDWQWTVRSGTSRMSVIFATQIILIFLLIKLTASDPTVIATGIFAFTYTLTIANKLFDLNAMTRNIEESLMEAQPIAEMFQQAIEIKDEPTAAHLKVREGGIAFKNVFFDYGENAKENAVFTDLNLTIKPGEKIGLVGSSGGGKSTLTRLLLRFEDIQAGEIVIDDQNIATVTQASLRQHIAYVPQEPLLFHRTIRDNITYGKPSASFRNIEAVAKQAHAHEFVSSLPEGYETLVGERGVKLSGGQKQRIAIARAMLKDAPILVLDEATSALDSESEVLIQDALWKLMEDRTTLVIAHRLSTIQKMDRIIVLDDGQIIEEGSHKQLIKRGGKYSTLWKHQSGGFIEE